MFIVILSTKTQNLKDSTDEVSGPLRSSTSGSKRTQTCSSYSEAIFLRKEAGVSIRWILSKLTEPGLAGYLQRKGPAAELGALICTSLFVLSETLGSPHEYCSCSALPVTTAVTAQNLLY